MPRKNPDEYREYMREYMRRYSRIQRQIVDTVLSSADLLRKMPIDVPSGFRKRARKKNGANT